MTTEVNINTSLNAAQRGWGSGWPNCSEQLWVPLEVESLFGGVVRFRNHVIVAGVYEEVDFPGGVREELAELMALLLQESESRGYINLIDGWCWGAACRPIKTSSGGLTDVPSNHSWGVAVDINAPVNGFGSSSHTIPTAMGKLWNEYGFRWGGDYSSTKDWMHFEFMGTPAQAREMLTKAKANGIGGEQVLLEQYQDGWDAFVDAFKAGKDPGDPKEDKPVQFKKGWNAARFAANNPKG